ncbi:MAG: NUDIX domain-containing protein [Candidatus Pacebacteria bacterium]|nr:NUDIX domain-containing protein [Candidatus Paceibacterota bacterium]
MSVEKSAGAVIFRKEPSQKEGKIYYLLLNYPGFRRPTSYWDLPKGHIEKGEALEDTMRREVREETGLVDIELVPDFKETIKYFFKWENSNIMKFVTFFIAKTKTKEVKVSGEHLGYEWLPYEEAIKKLTFKNAKNILQKVNDFISRKGL